MKPIETDFDTQIVPAETRFSASLLHERKWYPIRLIPPH